MKAEDKLAHRRLSVLELTQAPGNVSEACHRVGSRGRRSTNTSGASSRAEGRRQFYPLAQVADNANPASEVLVVTRVGGLPRRP